MKKLTAFLIVFAVIPNFLTALQSGAIIHQPVYEHDPGESLIIYAMVNSELAVGNLRLLYRSTGETGYIEEYMELFDDIWRGEIPQEHLSPPVAEYFLAATLVDGTILTYPETDAENAPIQINLDQSETGTLAVGAGTSTATTKVAPGGNKDILVFSPDPGATVPFDDIYIAVSLYNIQSVDQGSIRLLVDNRDVTKKAEVSSDFVAYLPAALPPGKHVVKIELQNTDGRIIPGRKWDFTVVKKTRAEIKREFTYRGKVNGSYSRDPQGEDDYLNVYKTKASFTGDWRWLRFKTDIKLTSDEDIYKQPKNRYRLSLSMGDKLMMNFGDFSSRLSKYTLDGKRIRGFDTDLKLGWISLHIVKGELLRDIQGRLGTGEAYTYEILQEEDEDDSTITNLIYQLDRKGYTFRRDITSGRLSFGDGRVFQLGFNWLKAKDDITSVNKELGLARISILDSTFTDEGNIITYVPGADYTYDELMALGLTSQLQGWDVYVNPPEDGNWKGDSPQDNIVIGSDIKLSLPSRRLSLEAGWAFSMLNTDIWDGAISLDALDTLMDDVDDDSVMGLISLQGEFPVIGEFPDPIDYEDLFVINTHMVPLIPIDIDSAQLEDNLFKAIANMPSLAYNFKLSANYFNNRLSVEYNRVGPKFNSLGNPYLQSDIREFIVTDRVRLLRNKLFVSTTYRHQDNKTVRLVPVTTTIKTITANIGVYPGPNYPTFNLKFSTKPRFNSKIYQDTTRLDSTDTGDILGVYLDDNRVDENTFNANLGINYSVGLWGMKHNIMVNYNKLNKEDQISDRYDSDDGYYTVGSSSDTTFFDTTYTSPKMSSDVTTISVVTDYSIPLKTTVVLSFNNRTTVMEEQGITGVNLNAIYTLFGGVLKVNGGFGYTSGMGSNAFNRFNIRSGVNYKILENLSLRASADLRGTDSNGSSDKVLIMRADLNYTF
ncbi:MAG: TonB-dependent receptor [Candidatus Marinimicrobia bacterium]|nr:TonB-dependent receptor [Candidatus Neomarinimicrobiota bacterium]